MKEKKNEFGKACKMINFDEPDSIAYRLEPLLNFCEN